MPNVAGGNGFNTTVLTANTAGTQIAIVGAQAASNAGAPASQGFIHSMVASVDSTAATISIYDGTSTAGTLKFKVLIGTAAASSFRLDIQFLVGIFIVVSGGTTPVVNVIWS